MREEGASQPEKFGYSSRIADFTKGGLAGKWKLSWMAADFGAEELVRDADRRAEPRQGPEEDDLRTTADRLPPAPHGARLADPEQFIERANRKFTGSV
jgi:hypothetical protein